jgi:hypothetical protein
MSIRAEIKVELSHHPDIHPDDVTAAFDAWFMRSSRERKKAPHIVLEKALIASAKGRSVRSNSRGFATRWKRAKKDGRVPIWDRIDSFILKNWRVMRLASLKNYPGLSEWSPGAATTLIQRLPIGANASGEPTWYVKKRNRLGLKGKRRYRVHNFWTCKDGSARIDVD